MSADDWFALMVVASLPAAVLYPLIYGTQTTWWKDWIGWALLTKAVGLAIMLGFSAAFQLFGPDYPGRNAVRNAGMAIVMVGLWLALLAMLRVLRQRRLANRRL